MQETDDAVLSDRASKQVIVLDKVSRCLHLIMGKVNETVEWQRVLRAAAVNNSRNLADQQLTKDDIPVIVDKCINFVYAHGMFIDFSAAFNEYSFYYVVYWLKKVFYCVSIYTLTF